MQTITTVISLAIAFTVGLNSVHGKDLLRVLPLGSDLAKTQTHDDATVSKIATDLHNHVDKAGKVLNDNPQSDTRSLRLLRLQKRGARQNLLENLFGGWREYFTLHLG